MSYYSNPVRNSNAPPKKLTIILINTILNNKPYAIEVSYWITISELKNKIEKYFGIPVSQQRLFFKTQELNQNNFSMIHFGGKKKIKIILRPTPTLENTLGIIKKYEILPKSKTLENLLFGIQEGFNLGLIPKLTFDGTSGTYFLRNKYRKNIAIFKPFDEEPFAPNNPKDYRGKLGSPGFKPGILSGESAIREVAAYLLDDKHFSGVPHTTFVEILHPYFSNRDMKEIEIDEESGGASVPLQHFSQYLDDKKKTVIKHGSLQVFIEGADESADYGYNLFPDEEVRKIAILDLRILNCDRNDGNILVKKEKGLLKLIPIDHGLSLPDCFETCSYDLVWMEWPQVKKKWTPMELDYIGKIDPRGDVEKLSKYFKFRDICLRNFRISETVLKRCAKETLLTLYDVGTIMFREDPDIPSPIEEIIRKTEEFYHTMKTSMPREIINGITQSEKKRRSKGNHFEEEKKLEEKRSVLVHDPLKDCQGMRRGRARSENYDNLDDDPLNSILRQDNIVQNTNSTLFTIPELTPHISEPSKTQKSSTKQHKLSFASKASSQEAESNEPSTDEEDENEENNAENMTRSLKAKRSSSIPAAFSRLAQPEKKQSEEHEDKEENNEKKIKKGSIRSREKKNTIPPQFDELFFKYFENFLDQRIQIMLKNKTPPTRARFLSEGV